MDKKDYIGVFDSGIGGLTVVSSLISGLPNENIVYFGDTAHVPYGTKSKRQIMEYVLKDVEFLDTFNIKAIIIACNTADSIAREKVKELYDVPVFGVVYPASKTAARTTENGKVGVIATKATINSKAYNKAIAAYDDSIQVFGQACPMLVPLVENRKIEVGDVVVETILREYLEPLIEQDIDTLILGCTHYPLLSGVIKSLYPHLHIISSSGAAARHIKVSLGEQGLLNEKEGGEHLFFVSDDAEGFEAQARIFMGDNLVTDVKQINLD